MNRAASLLHAARSIRWLLLATALSIPLIGSGGLAGEAAEAQPDDATVRPLVRAVDLNLGEAAKVSLADGSTAHVKLLDLQEQRDPLREAVRVARVRVEVNGTPVELVSANYRLPVTAAGVRIDCPITRGYTAGSSKKNAWGLVKDARLRLWPASSTLSRPGTFTYPVRQRWFASDTQMANEPTFVNGDEIPGKTSIYYHYGLDFGGAEGLVTVVAATDGMVVSAAGELLAGHEDSPAKPRYDVIYVRDEQGWYYRYSHLARLDVQAGQRVRMGQPIGLLGKEGGSGGWSHLHFDISSRQPSGSWGIQDAYAYAWEAYQREHTPELIAVARPHQLVPVGQRVVLDGSLSWSASGDIERYEWTLSDGSSATGPIVEREYAQPGTYSEILKVVDRQGRAAWDFAVVQVARADAKQLPPTIHAAYSPTLGIRPGDPVTFKVRSFRTTEGQEVWDFGDGSPAVTVRSDGNANVHAKDGYAVTEHRFPQAGHYLVRVQRTNQRDETATAHLSVTVDEPFDARTTVALVDGQWQLNGRVTNPGSRCEGLLMNVRMVNSVFEDRRRPEFDPESNTDRFLAALPDYAAHGVNAITVCLQGGLPGYEGALNSAFEPDGALRASYLQRVARVIEACDRQAMAVILGCYYQRQDQVLLDDDAVRRGVVNTVQWLQHRGYRNVLLEIANEFDHRGFDHPILRSTEGQSELIRLAKQTAPELLVSTSGLGHGRYPDELGAVADFLLIHFNGTPVAEIPDRILALKKHGKPIVCNEDDKNSDGSVQAAEASVANGASWGLMLSSVNQYFPLEFHGADDDPAVYRKLKELTTR